MAKRIINVDVVSDITCPFCFIGKRALDKAIRQSPQYDVRVHWFPFQLAPDMHEEMNRMEYLKRKFGNLDRINAMHQRLDSMGQEYDIHFQWDGLTGNTLLAHQLVDYAGNPEHGGDLTKQNKLMEELFKQVHVNRQSPASLPMLLETVEKVDLDREKVKTYLNAGENADAISNLARDAIKRGITGVPYFVIDKKYSLSGVQPVDAFIEAFNPSLT